jgi:anti-sigma factor RsiW
MQRHSATQTIRCEYVHSVLEEYLAGELNADTQAAIETHLATCQDCQNELDFALEVGNALQELPKPQPPAEVFDQVASYVQSHPKPTAQGWFDSLKQALRGLHLRPVAVGAVTASLIILVTFGAYQQHQQSLQIEQATYELSYALSTVRYAMQKTELALYEGLPSNEVMEAPRRALLFTLDEINTTTNSRFSQMIHKSLAIFKKINWKEIDK